MLKSQRRMYFSCHGLTVGEFLCYSYLSLCCCLDIIIQYWPDVLEVLTCEVYVSILCKDKHSRNGISATNPLSPASPFHLYIGIALSGCNIHESGFVSRRITFSRSRLRYERSCRQ